MKNAHNLSSLDWKLSGFLPHDQHFFATPNNAQPVSETAPLPARVPGSVQCALRRARLLPDWNIDLRSRGCEWVENRFWVFETELPSAWLAREDNSRWEVCCLHCAGLDGSGRVLLNGHQVGVFNNTFIPFSFDLAPFLQQSENRLQIVFETPPRRHDELDAITDWKPRFNYSSDWMARLVQIGIWDKIELVTGDGFELEKLRVQTEYDWASQRGVLRACAVARGEFNERHKVRVVLECSKTGRILEAQAYSPELMEHGIEWRNLQVDLWNPGSGERHFYVARIQLIHNGRVMQEEARRVGFKSIEWKRCKNSPPAGEPWLCVINGKPTFLQGVNWTPIAPNFADVGEHEYRQLLEQYQTLGCNLLRVRGGEFLEKEVFYNLCDELGILIWQEFPALDNRSIEALCRIASTYIEQRAHHPALLMWGSDGALESNVKTDGETSDLHLLVERWNELMESEDPTHRFVFNAESGPTDFAESLEQWRELWKNDDAQFYGAVKFPGASGADMIFQFVDETPVTPGTIENPLWRRFSRWLDWSQFVAEFGREPRDLQEYSAWSQERQKTALVIAARECKKRFPACGGFLIGMGHDAFPLPISTSIIDFLGRPKAAALGLGQVFQTTPQNLRIENE